MKGSAMLAMVASSTTISWATEMSTRAQPRWRVAVPVARRCGRRCGDVVMRSWVVAGCVTVGQAADGRRVGVVRGQAVGPVAAGHDDLVDDAGDGLLVGGLARDEAAVQDDPGQGRGEQVEVDVRGDLAALAGALEDARATVGSWAR